MLLVAWPEGAAVVGRGLLAAVLPPLLSWPAFTLFWGVIEGGLGEHPFPLVVSYLSASAVPLALGVAVAPLPRRLLVRAPAACLYLAVETFVLAAWLLALEAAGLLPDVF